MTSRPPSSRRVVSILVRIAMRRWVNRLVGQFGGAFKRKRQDAGRTGTPRKSRRKGQAFILIFGALFLFQGILISSQIIQRISSKVENRGGPSQDGPVVVSRLTFSYISILEGAVIRYKKSLPADSPNREEAVQRFREKMAERLERQLREGINAATLMLAAEEFAADSDSAIDAESPDAERPSSQKPDFHAFGPETGGDHDRRREGEIVERFRSAGITGFRAAPEMSLDIRSYWPDAHHEQSFLAAFGLLFTLLFLSLICTTLGSANQDLGRVEWNLEWLFTFPVKTTTLFAARLLEYTFVNALSWFTILPLSLTMMWAAGFGWWAVPIGLAVTLFMNVLVASCRLTAETLLRQHLRLSRLKNLQALFTVVGLVLLYVLFYVAIRRSVPEWFMTATDSVGSASLFLPWSFPLLVTKGGGYAWCVGGGLIAIALVVAVGGVRLSANAVRGGLISGGGAYLGTRGRAEKTERSRSILTGIVGKEIRLLLRDRNFFVQTLIVPLLIVGFQFVVNPRIIEAAGTDFRHVAMLAFGIGAYVLMFGGFSVLAVERNGLWLLYTFPRRLESILTGKAALWAGISALYVAGILALFLYGGTNFGPAAIGHATMALVGVMIYAFIAAGLGIMGTDPFEQKAQRRVKTGMVYGYLLLSSLYVYAIYSPTVWHRIVFLVLCSLLSYAIWQNVRDQVPYLLDPTESPPRRIALSDGLFATLAFFCLQSLVAMIWVAAQGGNAIPARELGFATVLAYAIAGGLVVLGSLFSFWRSRIPNMAFELGLQSRPAAGDERRAQRVAVGYGLLWGLIAGGFGLLYMEGVEHVPVLREMKLKSTAEAIDPAVLWWTAILAVGLAPPLEEFIFRGLVFRGLRRSLPAWLAILGSAAIFAVVHPPFSMIPVFVLGVVAGISFEFTGLLLTPVITHVVYNAIVVSTQIG